MHKRNTYLADREKAKTCLLRIYEIGNKFNPNIVYDLHKMTVLIENLFDVKQTQFRSMLKINFKNCVSVPSSILLS